MDDKPSIVEVIQHYTDLQPAGRELKGLCQLHDDRHPSMRVNPDKDVWFCPVCNIGGDIFTWLEKVEGLSFPQARTRLGLADQPRPTKAEITKRERLRRASKNLAAWALSVSERIDTRMREIGQRAHMARKVSRELPDANKQFFKSEITRAAREWEILSTLEEDLLDPKQTATLWEDRDAIERLVGINKTYSNEEIEDVYPPLTNSHRQRLTRYVRGEA